MFFSYFDDLWHTFSSFISMLWLYGDFELSMGRVSGNVFNAENSLGMRLWKAGTHCSLFSLPRTKDRLTCATVSRHVVYVKKSITCLNTSILLALKKPSFLQWEHVTRSKSCAALFSYRYMLTEENQFFSARKLSVFLCLTGCTWTSTDWHRWRIYGSFLKKTSFLRQ